MYTEFFQLREMPFSITPDPAYLYMSPRHQEALGHLLYGTGQYGGFVQLTGEVGTGKTTIVRTLLEQKLPDVDVAMIHNPRQSEQEFVQSICDELRVPYPRENPSLKVLVDALNEHLLTTHAAGRRTVVIIDEAQNLQPSVLEQVRLLTNLETSKEKLLRIMLIGQPELSALLARPDLRQLASRITARYHLTPLSAAETREYIEHRLRVAGASGEIFTPDATERVYRHARGIPRLVNIICDRALLGAYAQQGRRVTPDIVDRAAQEAIGAEPLDLLRPARRWRGAEVGWGLALLLCVALFLYSFLRERPQRQESAAAAPAVAAQSPAAAPLPAAGESVPVDDLSMLAATAQPLGTALGRLIRLWDTGITIPRGENVCEVLKRSGLECYRSTGGWEDLVQMNRPVIVTLELPDIGEHYFLLRSAGASEGGVETSLGTLTIPLAQLQNAWTGEFLLLWRRETRETYIGPGSAGPSIAWLWQRLAQRQQITPPSPLPNRFDPQLRGALQQFQTARGLVADGTAGVRTLIALGDGQPGTPTLLNAGGGR
jgi:general secretion pathway protein A